MKNTSDLVASLRNGGHGDLPNGWWKWPEAISAHHVLQRELLEHMPEPPPMHGRGVVICVHERSYASAYVCARMLRHTGCMLPIQFWHPRGGIDRAMSELVAEIGVATVCADDLAHRIQEPQHTHRGQALISFALQHCPYRDVLLVDADNVPVLDPTYLFDSEAFQRAGAIFWPSELRLRSSRLTWKICEVDYREEAGFDAVQMVVDKSRSWHALQLAAHYNGHSGFYGHHIAGIAEALYMAFRRVGAPYTMPRRSLAHVANCTCHDDFDGHRLFQHRHRDRWRLDANNQRIDDFWFEDVCRYFLSELRARWAGIVNWPEFLDERERAAYDAIAGRSFRYMRVGYDSRDMEFRSDGAIGAGSAACERAWRLSTVNGDEILTIYGDSGATCRLRRDDGIWKGRWLHHERMPIELAALAAR